MRIDPEDVVPTAKKKVIFIDQFAISNMAKAVDVASKSHTRTIRDSFWLTLFEALERACKLQLAVCPYFEVHRDESMVWSDFKLAKRIYEHFANGISFHRHNQIESRQLGTAAGAWIRGEYKPSHDFDTELITNGRLHCWQSRLLVSVDVTYPPETIDSLRASRRRSLLELKRWVATCVATPRKDFTHWFNIEKNASRDLLIDGVTERARWELQLRTGQLSGTPPRAIPARQLDQIYIISETFRHHGVGEADMHSQIVSFLDSDAFKEFPASAIASRLFAVIAHKASSGGQKHAPLGSILNDIRVVSSLLPYCDAMLIDNQARGMLNDIPSSHPFPFSCQTQVFSRKGKKNGEDFLRYLSDLEKEAEPGNEEWVRAIYGDGWLQPYLSILQHERRSHRGRERFQ